MEDNKNITDSLAATETLVDSIRKLKDAIEKNAELRKKLEDMLAALTGKPSGSKEAEQHAETEKENPEEAEQHAEPEKESPEEEEQPAGGTEKDGNDTADDSTSSSDDFSDIFDDDAITGLVLGFAAGVALIGGGILLHKLISDD